MCWCRWSCTWMSNDMTEGADGEAIAVPLHSMWNYDVLLEDMISFMAEYESKHLLFFENSENEANRVFGGGCLFSFSCLCAHSSHSSDEATYSQQTSLMSSSSSSSSSSCEWKILKRTLRAKDIVHSVSRTLLFVADANCAGEPRTKTIS